MNQRPIIIIGTGDFAEVALHFIRKDFKVEIAAFAVEKEFKTHNTFCDLEVIDFEIIEQRFPPSDFEILIAAGPNRANSVRQALYQKSINKGYKPYTYISPRANVWDKSHIGPGSFIFESCIVEPFAKIGQNSVMWSGSLVAHHSVVGDHCFLAPSCAVSGRSQIKDNCFLGINSTVRDNVIVAEKCIIGGGAVVKKNTEPGCVYSANPATLHNRDSFNTKV